MFNLYVLSICNTMGTREDKETALLRTDNAALLDMLKEKGSMKNKTVKRCKEVQNKVHNILQI
jgi:hypothetical protein